ncbi:thioredoxin domain-containing protein [Candidatus Microgenomates bacterium]|nr:thioredoxin domain-containing protein [Candidatus Microgenomates bacterium]
MKVFWVILAAAVAGLIAIFVVAGGRSTTPVTSTEPLALVADDHTAGPASAPATLIEYSDFQCPACASYAPIIERLQETFGKKLRFVYRHYPLTSIHANAFAASQAAEAATGQDKFFAMADKLFATQTEWSDNPQANQLFTEYAKELGLDLEAYEQARQARATTDRINRDVQTGQQLRLTGTPSFFLNEQKIEPRSYEEFKALIEAALD